jgi:molybdate transport system substrate-binding protein
MQYTFTMNRCCVLNLIFVLIAAAGCSTNDLGKKTPAETELTVSAAVSLKDALTEIGNLYKGQTGTDVTFNFGSSGALQKQIETGAPADIFASAGAKQMDELSSKGMIDSATRRDLAGNSLVVIVPADSKIDLKGVNDLSRQEVKKIAVGNPKTVPAGQYSEQFFQNAKLSEAVGSKLVLAEDVRQVLDYVSRGEVDAGVVYATDAKSAGGKVRVIATVSDDLHDPIVYPIAVIKDSKNRKAAEDFVSLVLSADGQAILQKFGFTAAK